MSENQDENESTNNNYNDWTAGLHESGQNVFKEVMEKNAEFFNQSMLDPFNMTSSYMDAMFSLWKDPSTAMATQTEFMNDSLKLWTYTTHRLMGNKAEPVITPESGDNRWRDEEWSENIIFDYIKQSYLLAAKCVEDTIDSTESLSQEDAKKLSFFTKQITDALSPTNYPATNPTVLRATMEQKGENLVKGIQNFVRDMEKGDGQLKIAMTDPDAFTLGENIAVTPGKVVFQNRLFQLIQYAPATDKVFKTPLLIVPPWINKFYILDLQPKNSLIKWLVDQGHTVFVVSWVNPDESYSDTDFEDYMSEGIYPALDTVEKITGEHKINIVGYCIGGTLLAGTLAHMKEVGDKRIKSATFFTALIDFEEPGDLGVFLDETQVNKLEIAIEEKGFLEGDQMSQAFNLLRSNDLIWSFYINNYLLGKDPAIFDLLYWNSDSTRMPAKMYSFYIRNMYLANKLCKPNAIKLKEVPVDIRNVDVPCYFISTKDDHIAPWHATYAGARLFSGPVRFVLGGSGHIAGIVNPPSAEKYYHYVGPEEMAEDPERWLEKSQRQEGSWWPDWHAWLSSKGKTRVNARDPEKGPMKPLEDAPGSYVAKRLT
jgi:polyhydroxyalkanoate synthase